MAHRDIFDSKSQIHKKYYNMTIGFGYILFCFIVSTTIPINLFFSDSLVTTMFWFLASLVSIVFLVLCLFMEVKKYNVIKNLLFYFIVLSVLFNILLNSVSNLLFLVNHQVIGEVNLSFVNLNHQCPGIDTSKVMVPAAKINNQELSVLCPTAIARPSSAFYHTAIVPNIFKF